MTSPRTPKKTARLDWHRADIVAALRKAGWSLRRLAKHHGYTSPTVLTNAMQRPWPRGERLIAEAIGVPPEKIWPTRYAAPGRRGEMRMNCSHEPKNGHANSDANSRHVSKE